MEAAVGPSKKPRLNDSFYDSEEDELVSQACCVTPKTSAATTAGVCVSATTPVSSTIYGRSTAASNFGTPLSTSGHLGGGGFSSAGRPVAHLPTSATTLKGKPLMPTTSASSAMADDDDISVIHTSKPFFRLAKEVKELSEERDALKGQFLFLEQSLRAKEKESQEHLQRITELTQKYTEAMEEIREVQRRSDEELVHLRTQLQFQTEQSKADTFKGGKLAYVDEADRPALASVQNIGKSARVPVIKPRMSTSSVNKSFSSALKPRLSRGVGNVSVLEEDEADAFAEHSDENSTTKEMNDKCIQTDAFRIADLITNPDILAKREMYDSILNTMIGSTFIISDDVSNDESVAERSSAAFDQLLNVDDGEHTLNEILTGK